MGEVELSYVVVTTTIEDALQVMRVHNRSGVVTGPPNGRFVLTGEDLIDALRERGNIAVGEVAPRHHTVRTPSTPHIARSLVFRDETPRQKIFEMMKTENAQFGVAAATALSVEVLTISENFSTMLGSRQILCRCRTESAASLATGAIGRAGKVQQGRRSRRLQLKSRVMLGTVIDVFKGFFSRSFWFGNFLPVAIFAFLHLIIAWWVLPNIPLAEWANADPKSLTYFPIALAVLVVIAYALIPIIPLVRGLLDGSLLPEAVQDMLRREHVVAARAIQRRVNDAVDRLNQAGTLKSRKVPLIWDARRSGNERVGAGTPRFRPKRLPALKRRWSRSKAIIRAADRWIWMR